MYSSEDLERFYFQYQTEGLPSGISLQTFCINNKVPYNIFSKWYKDTRKKIVEVKVEGLTPTRICVELRMSNGMHISQKNLTYRELILMIEKLEGLC